MTCSVYPDFLSVTPLDHTSESWLAIHSWWVEALGHASVDESVVASERLMGQIVTMVGDWVSLLDVESALALDA